MHRDKVIKALATERLIPRVVAGSSAGSIVTAVLGVRTDEEFLDLLEDRSTWDLNSSSGEIDIFMPFSPRSSTATLAQKVSSQLGVAEEPLSTARTRFGFTKRRDFGACLPSVLYEPVHTKRESLKKNTPLILWYF